MTQETIDAKKPTTFPSPFADTGDKTESFPTTATDAVSFNAGFPQIYSTPRANSGKSVARKDMNKILNAVSSLNYYFQYMGRNPWVDPNTSGSTTATGYPKGAKVWYTDSSDTTKTGEYVSTMDSNVSTPGGTDVIPETETLQWIKLNDLSGTSGGSTATCNWDATKIAGIISSLSSITSSITDIDTDIQNLSSTQTTIINKLDNLSVSPSFLDPSSVQTITGTMTSETAKSITASKNGKLFVTLSASTAFTGAQTLSVKVGSVELTKLYVYSNTNVIDRFITDIKQGQRITLTPSQAFTSSDYSCILVHFITS